MTDETNVIEIRPKRKPGLTDEARAKGRAAAKAKNYKPASGKPASGIPASGIPAMGKGWGGRAKGASQTSGDLTVANTAPRKTADKREAEIHALKTVIASVAYDETQPGMVRVAAADRLLDRLEGKPGPMIQKVIDASPFTILELPAKVAVDDDD